MRGKHSRPRRLEPLAGPAAGSLQRQGRLDHGPCRPRRRGRVQVRGADGPSGRAAPRRQPTAQHRARGARCLHRRRHPEQHSAQPRWCCDRRRRRRRQRLPQVPLRIDARQGRGGPAADPPRGRARCAGQVVRGRRRAARKGVSQPVGRGCGAAVRRASRVQVRRLARCEAAARAHAAAEGPSREQQSAHHRHAVLEFADGRRACCAHYASRGGGGGHELPVQVRRHDRGRRRGSQRGAVGFARVPGRVGLAARGPDGAHQQESVFSVDAPARGQRPRVQVCGQGCAHLGRDRPKSEPRVRCDCGARQPAQPR